MNSLKGWLSGALLMSLWVAACAQQNVSITISLIDSVNVEYEMQVVNNNTSSSGWAVDQVDVLYTTAGVLQATFVPNGWGWRGDVPWDAIPNALEFTANTSADRIAPGGGSRTFRYKMNTKTPAEDFYIMFHVVQGTQSQEYVRRIKVLQTINVPKDSGQIQQVNVPAPGGGMLQLLELRFRMLFPIPTLRYEIATLDQDGQERDRVQYPPAPIPQPPHLEHFFTGGVERQIPTEGVPPLSYWTLCAESAQWNSGATGIAELSWERDRLSIRRPSACWHFFPSLPLPDGGRIVRFRIANCGRVPFQGALLLYLRGDQLLACGADLSTWPTRFPPDRQLPLTLSPGQFQQIDLVIPAGVPPNRFFYGALDMESGDELPTQLFFAHQESDAPLLTGLLQNDGGRRPVQIAVHNPLSGFTRLFTTLTDPDGIWRIRLDASNGFAFFDDAGFYLPVWEVRVKPQGALSRTFQQVLVPGGDTLDPYLRMWLVLGDVNGDDCIDDADLLAVLFAFGQAGNLPEDLNLDGIVDDADLLIVLFHFGAGC